MQRRKFVKSGFIGASALSSGFIPKAVKNLPDERMVLELRQYTLIASYRQNDLEKFLRDVLVPALSRLGSAKAGCFTPLGKAEPAEVFFLAAYPGSRHYFESVSHLPYDTEFLKASASYDKLPAGSPVFDRYKSSLLLAFEGFPQLHDSGGKKLFELRTYEGYNEDAVRRKIAMFNNGEIDIFLKNKFNPVFYSENLTGDNLPCLTYMLAFSNMEERDHQWKDFGDDPDWKQMSSDPAYADTVSRIHKTFLEPVSWSQF